MPPSKWSVTRMNAFKQEIAVGFSGSAYWGRVFSPSTGDSALRARSELWLHFLQSSCDRRSAYWGRCCRQWISGRRRLVGSAFRGRVCCRSSAFWGRMSGKLGAHIPICSCTRTSSRHPACLWKCRKQRHSPEPLRPYGQGKFASAASEPLRCSRSIVVFSMAWKKQSRLSS